MNDKKKQKWINLGWKSGDEEPKELAYYMLLYYNENEKGDRWKPLHWCNGPSEKLKAAMQIPSFLEENPRIKYYNPDKGFLYHQVPQKVHIWYPRPSKFYRPAYDFEYPGFIYEQDIWTGIQSNLL